MSDAVGVEFFGIYDVFRVEIRMFVFSARTILQRKWPKKKYSAQNKQYLTLFRKTWEIHENPEND